MRPIGLLLLHRRHALAVPEPRWQSYVRKGAIREERSEHMVSRYLPVGYDPGETDRAHLEFALKSEVIDLRILAAYFRKPVAAQEIETLCREKPTGEYARRLWFLYEWLLETRLNLADAVPRSYVPVLDARRYVVNGLPHKSQRHHVLNNLLGTHLLCPIVERSATIDTALNVAYAEVVAAAVAGEDLALLHRATDYLYRKETRSSFQIEGETLDLSREERFVRQLETVANTPQVRREHLLEWQNQLVDPRYAALGYRTQQVYVGGPSRPHGLPRVHYIAPRPCDIDPLMSSFFELNVRLLGAHPLVHAALWSFYFVLIHPFDDGNGRLHRLLLHQVLRQRKLLPPDVVIPISAAIVQDRRHYDQLLESFSKPVLAALSGRYVLDDEHRIEVGDDSIDLYRSFNATWFVESLAQWLKQAITQDLPQEIAWLRRYDLTVAQIRKVVDLPDTKLRLLITLVAENHGRLSSAKRTRCFPELTDAEVTRLEEVVSIAFLDQA